MELIALFVVSGAAVVFGVEAVVWPPDVVFGGQFVTGAPVTGGTLVVLTFVFRAEVVVCWDPGFVGTAVVFWNAAVVGSSDFNFERPEVFDSAPSVVEAPLVVETADVQHLKI